VLLLSATDAHGVLLLLQEGQAGQGDVLFVIDRH
jgi:hypothetical protein